MANHTILVVDYDPKNNERTQTLLEGAGYRVHIAKDGVAALEQFRSLEPDLCLIEAMLPKKHGFEVCQEIKKSPEGKQVPVLLITAVYKGRKYRSQAVHLYGCDEYLEKPISDEDLRAAIDKHLEGRPARGAASVPKAAAGGAKSAAPARSAPRPVAATTAAPAPAAETTAAAPAAPAANGRIAHDVPPAEATASAQAPTAAPAPSNGTGEPAPAGMFSDDSSDFEDDIMSRLDAIMPDEPPAKPKEQAS